MLDEIIFPVLYIGDLDGDPWTARAFGVKRAIVTAELPPKPDDVDRYANAGINTHWAPCDPGSEIAVGFVEELVTGGPTMFSGTYPVAATLAVCWCLRNQSRTSETARIFGFDKPGELLRCAAQLVTGRLALYDVDVRIVGPQKRTIETYEKWILKNERHPGQ